MLGRGHNTADLPRGVRGRHSRVLVGALNAVEKVPILRVRAVHGGILWGQDTVDRMVKSSSIECWVTAKLQDHLSSSNFYFTLDRWSLSAWHLQWGLNSQKQIQYISVNIQSYECMSVPQSHKGGRQLEPDSLPLTLCRDCWIPHTAQRHPRGTSPSHELSDAATF